MATERSLQLYIIPQKVLTMSGPNVPNLFLCSALLTVASWSILYILYTMEQSPSWEAERSSASQEIPCILWNLKVHFCIYKSAPPVPIPCPLHHFFKIHFNITSHLGLGLSSGLFLSSFPTINIFFQILDLNFAIIIIIIIIIPMRDTNPPHPILFSFFEQPNNCSDCSLVCFYTMYLWSWHRHFGCTCCIHAQGWRNCVKLDAVMIKSTAPLPTPNITWRHRP